MDGDVAALDQALREGVRQCKADLGYTPTYFIRMISDHGAVDTVRQLIINAQPSDGFTYLSERSRLDLTVEFVALWPEFVDLFSPAEREAARMRLEAYSFDVDTQLAAQHEAG